MQGWIPRPLIVAAIVFIAIIELVSRTPDMLLIKERYDAQKAEYLAKLYQTDTAKAQLQKAQADADRAVLEAQAAKLQPDLAKAQLDRAEADAATAKAAAVVATDLTKAQLARAEYDATVAKYTALMAPNQPPLLQAQLEKAVSDAKTAALQPNLTMVQFEKLKLETLAAAYMPTTSELQMTKLAIDTQLAKAALPIAQQSLALSGAMINTFSPFMQALLGIAPQQQQPQQPHQPQQQQPSQQRTPPASRSSLPVPIDPNSADYRQGLGEAKKYIAYVATLAPDQRAGDSFWFSIKDKNPPPDICTTKAAGNFQFQVGCQSAREMYETVTTKNPPNFVAGFKAGWGG